MDARRHRRPAHAANFTHTGGNRALTAPWAGIDVIAHLRLSGSTPPPPPPPPPPGALLGHYSFNETAGTITNHGSAGTSLNLTNTGGAAGRDNVGAGGYGAPGHTGYGNAFNVLASGDGTYHSASSGSSLGGGLLTAAAVPQSSLQGSDGAFTYEAFVALSTTTGEQTILSHDGSSTRGFHFHLNGNQLRFYTGTTTLTAPIPTSGTHAFAANQWFHVAVAYNGQQGAANNTRFYWTALAAPVAEANLVGTATLAADLDSGVSNVLGVGTTTRSFFRFELRGLVDEVRLTSSAVGAAQFAFLSGGTTPPPGPSVTLTTSDTWDQTSFTSGARWSDGQVPHAGASYVVDGLDLRTPGNTASHTFGGDSLLLMDGGALVMRTSAPGVVTIGDLRAEGGAVTLAVNTAFTLAGDLTLQGEGIAVRSNTTTRTLAIQSRITGTGGLTVDTTSANNHVTLTHSANTYSGGTTITSGLLRAHADNALGTGTIIVANGAALHLAQGTTHNYIHDTATVIVGASATLHLGFTGTDTVSSLSLDGGATYVPNGQWGAVGSGAPNTSARLTGTGRLLVSGTAN